MIYEQLNEATARIETVLHVGGMLGDCPDEMASPLEEALEDMDEREIKRIFPEMPKGFIDNSEDFWDWLFQNKKRGFLVQFATPVMRPLPGGVGTQFSWGHYRTHWVYAETMEEALTKGLAWVAEMRELELG